MVLVQHIAPGFAQGLAEWLGQVVALPVKLGEAGEALLSGTVYLAPDGTQMGVGPDGRIRLARQAGEDGFCPSVTYLFRTVAQAYGAGAAGVLLTGMGRDGAQGLLELRRAGAVTVAQDEESSAIFGMPGEAVRVGAAEHVLPPEEIAALLRSLVTAR